MGIGNAFDPHLTQRDFRTAYAVRARDLAGTSVALDTSLREDFGASRWLILLTSPDVPRIAELPDAHVRVVPRGSPELRIFETFFDNARPRSGQIRDTQREYLFNTQEGAVGSMVMIPLGEHAALGLLAIASNDTQRYLPTMSTDFLVRIGEIVSEALLARAA